jgi:hypothetical protein
MGLRLIDPGRFRWYEPVRILSYRVDFFPGEDHLAVAVPTPGGNLPRPPPAPEGLARDADLSLDVCSREVSDAVNSDSGIRGSAALHHVTSDPLWQSYVALTI